MKCLVFGCSNHDSQGRFVGGLCAPCHGYLSTGIVGHTDSFLGKLCSGLTRMERCMAERTCELLGQNPRLQAKRIADHYVSLAIAARDLRDLDPAIIDETINRGLQS